MSKIPVSKSNLEISCPFLPAMTKASMLFPLQANRTCLPALIAVRQAPCSMLHADFFHCSIQILRSRLT